MTSRPASASSGGPALARASSILALVAALGLPGSGVAQAGERSSLDPAGVARAIIAADNARDLNTVMSLYAADAELWPPGEPPVHGREAIEARYRQIFGSSRPSLRTTIHRLRDAGEWALIEGGVQGAVSPLAGGDPVRVTDKYLMVLERSDDGLWRITRLMWSSNLGKRLPEPAE